MTVESKPHSVLDEVAAELEYLMSAAERPGTISHHDAEDAEARLLAHVRGLEEQFEALREASLENAEQNAITYRLAYLLGLREEWAGAVPPPAFVDASTPARNDDVVKERTADSHGCHNEASSPASESSDA